MTEEARKDRPMGHLSSFMVLLEQGPLTWKLWPMCSSGGELRHSAEPRGWRAGRSSSVRFGRPGEEEHELSGGQQEPCVLESCTLLSVSLLSCMRRMCRGLQKGACMEDPPRSPAGERRHFPSLQGKSHVGTEHPNIRPCKGWAACSREEELRAETSALRNDQGKSSCQAQKSRSAGPPVG